MGFFKDLIGDLGQIGSPEKKFKDKYLEYLNLINNYRYGKEAMTYSIFKNKCDLLLEEIDLVLGTIINKESVIRIYVQSYKAEYPIPAFVFSAIKLYDLCVIGDEKPSVDVWSRTFY